MSWICSLTQQRDHAQLLQERRVEGNLVETVEDIARGPRCIQPLARVDLDQDGIMRVALADKRGDGRIASKTAVPIGLAVDLDSLEHCRKACRGQQDVGRDLAVAKDSPAAGVHICGSDEQLDRRCYEALEIDALGQYPPKRVETHGVEVVRREYARHQIDGEVCRRCVERPAARQTLQGRALQRAEGGCM